MRKSKLHYIKLSTLVDETKLFEMFKVVYDDFCVKNIMYIKETLVPGEKYSCWLFEDSYLKIDDYTYLWKLPSAFSPNDTAGNFAMLDKSTNPVVLDLNVDKNSYPPFGFKFSEIKDTTSDVISFFDSIKEYKDMNEGNFFYIETKQELIDIIEKNNINLWDFDDDILDKIDDTYYSNSKFDINATTLVSDKFNEIFAIVSKTSRDILLR